MERLLLTIKWALVGWGAVSLIFCLWSLTVFLATFDRNAGSMSHGEASLRHFHSALALSGLGAKPLGSVPQSYERHAKVENGIQLEICANTISPLSLEDLKPQAGADARWYRGDQLPPVVDDAVTMIGQGLDALNLAWFPKTSELKSGQIYAYPLTINYTGVTPTTASVIFIRPSDQMVFFVDFKL